MNTESAQDAVLAKADHFSGLLTGVDPVVALSPPTLKEAIHALRAAVDLGHTEYGEMLSVAESAHYKTI